MFDWKRIFKGRIASTAPQPLPVPPGQTNVILKMSYGSTHTITFRGTPGRSSEEVARAYKWFWKLL